MPIHKSPSEISVVEEKVQPLTRIVYISPILAFASETYRELIRFRLVHSSFYETVSLYSPDSLRHFLNAPEQFNPSNKVALVSPQAAHLIIDIYEQKALLKTFLSTVDKRTGKKIGLEILEWAANNNYLEFIKSVLTKCEKSAVLDEDVLRFDDDRLLNIAVRENDFEMVESLLMQYEKMDKLEEGLRSGHDSPLKTALKSKKNDVMVEYLLMQYKKRGLLAESLWSDGHLILIIAALENNIPILKGIFEQYEKAGLKEKAIEICGDFLRRAGLLSPSTPAASGPNDAVASTALVNSGMNMFPAENAQAAAPATYQYD